MTVKNILVIRFRRVGDAVLATVICSSLRKTFPDANIDYVLNENIAGLYIGHPDIDRVITFSNEEINNIPRYILKVRKIMCNTRYDVIIDTRSTVKTLFFSLFSLRTPFRVGSIKKYNYLVQNYRIKNRCDHRLSMISQNLMFLKPLEKIADVKYVRDFRLYITDDEKKGFRNYMEEKGIDFSRPVVITAVTARIPWKIWDKNRMEEVLKRIISKYDAQLVFNFSGKIEEVFAMEIQRDMKNDPGIFTSVRAKTLREFMALVANCNFFFGNEGGPRHIAQALGVPACAIFPPGIFKSTWLPCEGEHNRGISPEDFYTADYMKEMNYCQCFDLLDADKVWEAVDKFLSDHMKKSAVL